MDTRVVGWEFRDPQFFLESWQNSTKSFFSTPDNYSSRLMKQYTVSALPVFFYMVLYLSAGSRKRDCSSILDPVFFYEQ